MNRSGKKCVLYPRVSTEMQVDGFSLDGQKSNLRRFADREEMEIVNIYEDAGKSGKSIEGRSGDSSTVPERQAPHCFHASSTSVPSLL